MISRKLDLRRKLDGRSILSLAQDVHSASIHTIDCDLTITEDQVDLLLEILECWDEPSSPFDLLVKNICKEAIFEFSKMYLKHRLNHVRSNK